MCVCVGGVQCYSMFSQMWCVCSEITFLPLYIFYHFFLSFCHFFAIIVVNVVTEIDCPTKFQLQFATWLFLAVIPSAANVQQTFNFYYAVEWFSVVVYPEVIFLQLPVFIVWHTTLILFTSLAILTSFLSHKFPLHFLFKILFLFSNFLLYKWNVVFGFMPCMDKFHSATSDPVAFCNSY